MGELNLHAFEAWIRDRTMVSARHAPFYVRWVRRFLQTRRETLSEDDQLREYLDVLEEYVDRYRWRIATPDDLLQVAESVSGRDLTDLYNRWILSKE